MSAEHQDINEEHAPIAQMAEATSADDSDSKAKYECEHCGNSYLTKKSLLRHIKSTDTVCAKQRLPLEEAPLRPPKPRWACSRCGKDCATSSSVDRHISRSCWKTCDECAIDGVTRCDSIVKTGPCRACEAKERTCTKHTDPISGTKPLPFTGPPAPAREKTLSDRGGSATSQNPGKRKLSASPKVGTTGAHKSTRKVSTNLPVDGHVGRQVDPLGVQAYVPSPVKKAAVSNWLLQQQSCKSASAASQDETMQDPSPYMDRSGATKAYCSSQQPQQVFESSQNFARALPTAASYLPAQQRNATPAPYYRLPTPSSQSMNSSHAADYSLTALPPSLGFPQLPAFDDTSATQLGGLSFQTQATHHQQSRHQQQALQQQTLRRQAFPQQYGGQQQHGFSERRALQVDVPSMSREQNAMSASPLEYTQRNILSQNNGMLTLRIYSNTHDTHGQPIFSILHVRRNEIFGPHLNAYCINRGKEYGLDWMFVYRYRIQVHPGPSYPKQYKQIALTWDMTPADVKDVAVSGATMQHLDTIYVVQATPLTHSGNTDAASPGPELARTTIDICPGETPLYQSPDVNAQWYRAVEHDSAQLRVQRDEMKKTMARQQARIAKQDEEIATQGRLLGEMTELSRQLRGKIQIPASNPLVEKLEKQWEDVESHILGSEDAGSVLQLLSKKEVAQDNAQTTQGTFISMPQTTTRKTPTPFVAACEAVRTEPTPAQRSAIPFPPSNAGFAADFSIPAYTHVPNVGAAFNTQMRRHGRFVDAADKVGAEAFARHEMFDGGEDGVGVGAQGEGGYDGEGEEMEEKEATAV